MPNLPQAGLDINIRRGEGMNAEYTVEQWRTIIERECPYVNKKRYSHNIISIALSAISKLEGQESANKAIIDFKLKKLGWHEVKT